MAAQLVAKHLRDHCCHGVNQLRGFGDDRSSINSIYFELLPILRAIIPKPVTAVTNMTFVQNLVRTVHETRDLLGSPENPYRYTNKMHGI